MDIIKYHMKPVLKTNTVVRIVNPNITIYLHRDKPLSHSDCDTYSSQLYQADTELGRGGVSV